MRIFLAALLFVALPAQAQMIEPGEWSFTIVLTSLAYANPQTVSHRFCVTKEQANDPMRWGSNPSLPGDCQLTTLKKGPDSASWQLSCPSTGMTGAGSARLYGSSLESEMQLGSGSTAMIRAKTSGKRLGPCN